MVAHNDSSPRYDAPRGKNDDTPNAIHAAWEPTQDVERKILRDRSRKLAEKPPHKAADEQLLELLVFRLSGELYGLETSYIREVFFLRDYTPLPFTPAWLVGICSIRGRFVSITDIRGILGLQIEGIGEFNKVILIHSQMMGFGIISDEVVGIEKVPESDLQKEFHLPGERAENYIAGVTSSRLIVLDCKKLLTDENLIVGAD